MNRERAYVAGRGAVSAFGVGFPALARGVFGGQRGLEPLRRLASVECLTEVAGEVPEPVVDAAGGEAGLALHMAIAAAKEALGEADTASIGLVLSTTKADLGGVQGKGEGLGSPARLARRLGESLGLGGPQAAVSCACSSGGAATALAARWIERGHATRVLVVGVDALTPFVLRGFSSLLALDSQPCRPFDRERAGLSLGEGAAALLLSARENESLRGTFIAGWGESNDANHVTGPSRDGSGLRLAAERALARAGIRPAEVDAVHVHGTGTRYNDASEALALVGLFGGKTPPAFGSKGQTGHALGATAVFEILLLLEALHRGEVPGNVGLEEPDVNPALTLSQERVTLSRARYGLKVSAGFGGINAAVVVCAGPE